MFGAVESSTDLENMFSRSSHSRHRGFGRSQGMESRLGTSRNGSRDDDQGLESSLLHDGLRHVRPTVRYGWDREGRVRLDEPQMLPSRRDSVGMMGRMGRMTRMGGLGGLGGFADSSLSGGGGEGRLGLYERPRGSLNSLGLGSGYDGSLQASRYDPYLDDRASLHSRLSVRERLLGG